MLTEQQMQRLFQYAMALCQHREDAMDALQSALEAYLSQDKHSSAVINDPEFYIRTSIRNRIFDLFKSQKIWASETYSEGDSYDISPLDLEKVHIVRSELDSIWAQIDVLDRDILFHWAVLGYSTDEACEILGLPRGTFLSRMHRLKKRINTDKDSESKLLKKGDA